MNKRMAGMIAAVAATATLAGAATAGASPTGPGVQSKALWQTTVDGKDYIRRQLTIPSGQSTGWHLPGL